MATIRTFAHNGWIVHHPNPEADIDYHSRGALPADRIEFRGRRPVVVDPYRRHIYVGDHDWYHHDAEQHHHLDDVWDWPKGYFGGGSDWGKGSLSWFGTSHNIESMHPEISQALTDAGFDIPNSDNYSEEQGLLKDQGGIDWDDDDDEND